MQDRLPPAAQEKYQEMQALQAEAESVVTRREQAEERRADARAARRRLTTPRDRNRCIVGSATSESRPMPPRLETHSTTGSPNWTTGSRR